MGSPDSLIRGEIVRAVKDEEDKVLMVVYRFVRRFYSEGLRSALIIKMPPAPTI